jgi:UDP-N-acetylmuramoylalanine--D-glutamate ligase
MNRTYIENLKTPVAIIGLGKSGSAALKLLKNFNFSEAQLLTYDEKDPTAQFKNSDSLVEAQPQTLVVSPGVPLNQIWIQNLIQKGAHLTSEISLAASLITTEKIIGVTGSVGKSTVVSVLGVGALCDDPSAFVGGNLGNAFCNYADGIISGGPKARWIILELSSYQLENCTGLSLEHSIITYLSPNHLERYENLEHYYKTKLKITELTKGLCLFNKTSADCEKYAPQSKCAYELINAKSFSDKELLSKIYLIGEHNKDNFSLAAAMAHLNNWPIQSFVEMSHYPGLPHRLEFVATLNDVTFINDSKATAMDSVLVATKGCLENLAKNSNLYLLLGGKDKNLPWEELSSLSAHKQITPVFFGACGSLAKEKSKLGGEYFEKLGSAVNYAQKRAQPGDIVLMSPGGTSLDEFKNFEERGDFFKALVLTSTLDF